MDEDQAQADEVSEVLGKTGTNYPNLTLEQARRVEALCAARRATENVQLFGARGGTGSGELVYVAGWILDGSDDDKDKEPGKVLPEDPDEETEYTQRRPAMVDVHLPGNKPVGTWAREGDDAR